MKRRFEHTNLSAMRAPTWVFRLTLISCLACFAASADAALVVLECRYVQEHGGPDWITRLEFDSEKGDASLTAYPDNLTNLQRYHRTVDRLPIERRSDTITIRRADSEKTYIIDRESLKAQSLREEISTKGTLETFVQFGQCELIAVPGSKPAF